MWFRLLLAGHVLAAALFALIYVGDSYRQPLRTTPVLFGMLAVLAATTPWLRRLEASSGSGAGASGNRLAVRLAALAGLGWLPVLLSTRPYQGFVLFPHRGPLLWTVASVAAALLLGLLLRPPRPRAALLGLLGSALALRVLLLDAWEIHPRVRDMLPLVISALERFLAGQDPYGVHAMQVHSELPLTYPPALWLAYLPAHLLGLDVRWTNVAADAVVALGLGLPALRRPGGALVLVGLAAYLFCPDVHWNATYAEPHVDWAVLSVLAGAMVAERPRRAALALGVAMLTRPFDLLLVPFVALWAWRRHGGRAAWRLLWLAGLLAALGYVPFVAWDPDAFFFGTVRWLLDYGPAHRTWFHGMMGFSGPLYARGMEAWLPRAQALVALLGVGGALALARSTRGLLAAATLTYAGFVAFNSLIWMSFWIGVALLAVATASASPETGRARVPADAAMVLDRAGRWARADRLVPPLVAAAALYLLSALHGYLSESGREQVVAELRAALRPGDRVLDLSGPRLHFVRTPPLLAPGELPPGTRLAFDPFSEVLPRRRPALPGEAARWLVVSRHGAFAPLREALLGLDGRGPYRLAAERRIGRYRWLELRRAAEPLDPPLSARAAELRVSLRRADGSVLQAQRRGAEHRFDGLPPWAWVRPAGCRVGGLAHAMLAAHPVQDATVRIEAPVPPGARRALLVGGLQDGAPEWRRSPVLVRIETGVGEPVERRFPNRTGLRGVAFPVAGRALAVEVRAEEVGRRHFCLQLRWFR